jgi:hypothetical protein
MPPIGGKRPDPFTRLRRFEIFSLLALSPVAATNPAGLAQDKAVQISCEVEFWGLILLDKLRVRGE